MKFIFNVKYWIVLSLLTGICIALVYYLMPSPTAIIKSVASRSDNIDTVIAASVESIKGQNKLLVMQTQVTGQATSEVSSAGMTAKQTDIASGETQYFVDLSKFDKSMITVNAFDVTVTIPSSTLSVERGRTYNHETYNNGSWLFTFDSTTEPTLTKINNEKLDKTFIRQGELLVPNAIDFARLSIGKLLSTPLQAAGVNKKVIVKFI